jgi:hypothetical protein
VAAVLAVAMVAGAARGALQGPGEVYEGELDGKISVTMDLLEAGLDHSVSGSYRYAIRGKDLYLKGSAEGDRLTVTEETDEGKKSGTFVLTRNDDQTLTGTWMSADGKREMNVALARIGEKKASSEFKEGSYRVSMGYLVFPSRNTFLQNLNSRLEFDAQAAKEAAMKEAREDAKGQAGAPKGLMHYEFASTSDPEVTYADAAVVSIRTIHSVDSGGAHPNYTFTAATYAWQNEKLVALGVDDLVKPGAIKALAAACGKSLREQKASWPEQAVMDKEHPPTVNVTKAGLLVTFDPYVAGSYAEGAYFVVIPWKEAADMIPAGSPIWRLTGATPVRAADPVVQPQRSPAVSPGGASGGGGDFPRPG